MSEENSIAILGRTTSTATFLQEKLGFDNDNVFILAENDPPYKTYGKNDLTIFTDIEPEKIDSRWTTECSQRNWELIFIDDSIRNCD